MAVFPGSLPPTGSASSSVSLATAGHTALHNDDRNEIRAIATKVGTGSSTASSGTVLRGTGSGTSSWGQVDLTTDVTGTLPIGSGGTGTTSTTGTGSVVYGTSPTITTPTISSPTVSGTVTGGTYASATLTQPTIADLTNATHDHTSNSEGGTLSLATISTAAWTPYTPSWTAGSGSGQSINNGTLNGRYVQIGKTIIGRIFMKWGNTTTAGTANGWYFSLPINNSTTDYPTNHHAVGTIYVEDSGVTAYFGQARILSSGQNKIYVNVLNASGTYVGDSGLTATNPFAWATNDFISVEFIYEID